MAHILEVKEQDNESFRLVIDILLFINPSDILLQEIWLLAFLLAPSLNFIVIGFVPLEKQFVFEIHCVILLPYDLMKPIHI